MSRSARIWTVVFVAGAIGVVAVWWSGLRPSDLGSVAGVVNAGGRLAALLGTYLLVIQLVLRTHVPFIVTAFGKDALRAVHTWNAYGAVGLLSLHVVAQSIGYALEDRVDVLGELRLLILHYDGIVLAIAGFLLLLALTIASLDRFRHRIAWPTWRALHLYMYAAVLLAVPHELATGSDFVDAPAAAAFWVAVKAFVLGVLLAARVPPMWRAASAAGAPRVAVSAVGAAIVAAYLLGTIKLSEGSSLRDAATASEPAPSVTRSPAPTRGPAALVSAAAALTVDGDLVDTPYGGAQVRLVLTDGRISDVEALALPSATRRSQTISRAAEPWLRKRAIAAQSGEFDVLSGATYTSRAYMSSVESAMRAAGLAEH